MNTFVYLQLTLAMDAAPIPSICLIYVPYFTILFLLSLSVALVWFRGTGWSFHSLVSSPDPPPKKGVWGRDYPLTCPHRKQQKKGEPNWTYIVCMFVPPSPSLPSPPPPPSLPSIPEHYSQHHHLFMWWMLWEGSQGPVEASQETRAYDYPPDTEEGMQHKWSKYSRCLPSHYLIPYSWLFLWVEIFMKSSRRPWELIFAVLNFMTPTHGFNIMCDDIPTMKVWHFSV